MCKRPMTRRCWLFASPRPSAIRWREMLSRRAFLSASGAALAAPGRRPNLIVILADDMGFSDVGAFGGEIETPNLDRLASNGLRFSQMYSAARCMPSRGILMTGY